MNVSAAAIKPRYRYVRAIHAWILVSAHRSWADGHLPWLDKTNQNAGETLKVH